MILFFNRMISGEHAIFSRKAKIVATLGPSSSNLETIKKLAEAGVDVFRLNFSHGSHEMHLKNSAFIRQVENEIQKPLAIMMDLQGPKIRVGVFEDGKAMLEQGAKFTFDLEKEFGNSKRVCLPHPEIFNSLKEGTEILIDDGKLRLKVMNNDGKKIEAEVLTGGVISNRKGVNIPNAILPITALTEKDKADLAILKEVDANWLAISFVQNAEDINYAKSFANDSVSILAKIEKPSAVKNIDSILKVSDAIMIARGDLGVELPFESIPGIQMELIRKARQFGKPVVVATQMLESMISCKVPTRAEVSDVAYAIAEEADAVMLSAESASGEYPEEAVKTMKKIIVQTENDKLSIVPKNNDSKKCFETYESLCENLNNKDIKVIAAFTESGRTAISVSKVRPDALIIALTPNVKTSQKLSICWGIHSLIVDEIFSLSQMLQIVQRKLGKFLNDNDKVLIVAGIPFRTSGTTNLFHICQIDKCRFLNEC